MPQLGRLSQARTTLRWLTVLASLTLLGMLLASFLLWDSLRQTENRQHARELDAAARSLAARIEARVQERITALARMANRWSVGRGTPRPIWEADAAAYIRDMPEVIALQWLDATARVRWVVPLAGNEPLLGAYPNRDRIRLSALETARAGRRAVLSAPVNLIQGGTGVLVFHPVQVQERFDGFLVSVIPLEPLVHAVLADESAAWRVGLRYAGRTVHGSVPEGAQGTRTALAVGDGRWELNVAPPRGMSEAVPLSTHVLAAGLAGTLLIAGVLWFWRLALVRARDNARLAYIVGRTTNAVILTDARGRIEWVNDGFTRISGYTLEEVRRRTPGSILQGPDTDLQAVARMRHHLAAGEGFREEILNYHRNGSVYWLDIEVQPLGLENGVPTGFMAIESDITERKRAEHSLHETQAFLEAVIDNLPLMLFVKEAKELRFVTLNRAGEELLGLGREQLLGKNDYDFFPKEQADFFVARDREVLSSGKRLEIAEEPIDTARGTRLLHTIKVPISDADGRPVYLLGISADITERRAVERMKSEFIATVSHELRTPLTSIRGALGLVAGAVAGPVPEQAKQLLDIAVRNSDRLTALINDILDVEKIESGRMKFAFDLHRLETLVTQALEANAPYAATLDVALHLLGPVPAVEVNTDDGRFLQVMTNLLSNAAKFSPKGAVVEIGVSVHDDHVRIAVTDRGPGIPEAFRERIFQKFSQADSSDSRAKGGTGLGLAISKSIVEQMGGRIGFESGGEAGTTFYFDLPLARGGTTQA